MEGEGNEGRKGRAGEDGNYIGGGVCVMASGGIDAPGDNTHDAGLLPRATGHHSGMQPVVFVRMGQKYPL